MSSPALANRRPGTERFHPSAHLLCDGPHEHTRRETHDIRHDRSSPDARSMNRTASLEPHPAAAWAGVYPLPMRIDLSNLTLWVQGSSSASWTGPLLWRQRTTASRAGAVTYIGPDVVTRPEIR